jgi:hypothetical protein
MTGTAAAGPESEKRFWIWGEGRDPGGTGGSQNLYLGRLNPTTGVVASGGFLGASRVRSPPADGHKGDGWERALLRKLDSDLTAEGAAGQQMQRIHAHGGHIRRERVGVLAPLKMCRARFCVDCIAVLPPAPFP